MIKSLKSLIIVGLSSLALVACSQQGGGSGSKKSKTLDNTKKSWFCKMWGFTRTPRIFKC
jgi:ABC-type glycerol-3-phosphate transport system substrate-binding protein